MLPKYHIHTAIYDDNAIRIVFFEVNQMFGVAYVACAGFQPDFLKALTTKPSGFHFKTTSRVAASLRYFSTSQSRCFQKKTQWATIADIELISGNTSTMRGLI